MDGIEEKENRVREWEKKKGKKKNVIDRNPKGKAVCPHLGRIVRGVCKRCRQHVEEDITPSIRLRYISKDYELSGREADELRKTNTTALLRSKKLILILDLDHTLLQSTCIEESPNNLRPIADPLESNPESGLFRLDSVGCLTKLRPFVRTFLCEASDMFHMYLYTMGDRKYALEMAKILDPKQKFFNCRVVCRKDCTTPGQKGLDVVLGEERIVVIVDDTRNVWKRHLGNLIQLERYNFFGSRIGSIVRAQQHMFMGNTFSEFEKEEGSDEDDVLAKTLCLLKKLHMMFFDPAIDTDLSPMDTRDVLNKIREEEDKDNLFDEVASLSFS